MVSAEGACAAYYQYGRSVAEARRRNDGATKPSPTAMLRKARRAPALEVAFVEENAAQLEACVRALAERFERGGRLLVMGNGGSACDAQHVAVEFQHPILEKRRALPALALAVDAALLTAVGNDADFSQVFVRQIDLLARAEDAVLGLSTLGRLRERQPRPAPRPRRKAADDRLRRDATAAPWSTSASSASSSRAGRSTASRRRTRCCCTCSGIRCTSPWENPMSSDPLHLPLPLAGEGWGEGKPLSRRRSAAPSP